MNTHLAHRSQDEPGRLIYRQGARDEIIPNYNADGIVFIGDFNDVPGSETNESVKEYLTDVWEVIGEGDGFTIPPDNPNRRIDYIFFDDGLVPIWARVQVVMASDHLLVIVKFELKN